MKPLPETMPWFTWRRGYPDNEWGMRNHFMLGFMCGAIFPGCKTYNPGSRIMRDRARLKAWCQEVRDQQRREGEGE